MNTEAKDYLHNLGESIVGYMASHPTIDLDCKENMAIVDRISWAAERYNEIAEFIRNYCDEKDGTLYHREDRIPLASELRMR